MNLSEINFEYYIDSSIDLDEILDLLKEKLQTGTLTYYEGEYHKEINKRLDFEKLKKETLEAYNDDKWPSIESDNLEIIIGEDDIQINSKIKLNLEEFDAEEKIK